MIVWTRIFEPFTDVRKDYKNIATEINEKETEWIALGKGYYAAKLQNGCYFEKTTGALIGTDLKSIRRDIKATTEEIIDKQIKDMMVLRTDVDLVSNEEFFNRQFTY